MIKVLELLLVQEAEKYEMILDKYKAIVVQIFLKILIKSTINQIEIETILTIKC